MVSRKISVSTGRPAAHQKCAVVSLFGRGTHMWFVVYMQGPFPLANFEMA